MTALALLGVALAGALGAPARFLLERAVQSRHAGPFPWGTLAVNITGSFVLGVLTGFAAHHGFGGAPQVWLTTGLCGAFTTFSTFTWETLQLVEAGELRLAAGNVAASVAAGLTAAAAGTSLVYVLS